MMWDEIVANLVFTAPVRVRDRIIACIVHVAKPSEQNNICMVDVTGTARFLGDVRCDSVAKGSRLWVGETEVACLHAAADLLLTKRAAEELLRTGRP